jgi:hypothetical protein
MITAVHNCDCGCGTTADTLNPPTNWLKLDSHGSITQPDTHVLVQRDSRGGLHGRPHHFASAHCLERWLRRRLTVPSLTTAPAPAPSPGSPDPTCLTPEE